MTGSTDGADKPARPGRLWWIKGGRALRALAAGTALATRRGLRSARRRARRRICVSLARRAWPLVVLYAIGAYFAANYVLPDRLSADTNLYVVQPLMWGVLGLLALSLLFLSRTAGYRWIVPLVLLGAGWAATLQVASQISAGALYGFGHSPYSREPAQMVENGLYVGTVIAGVECSRAYLLGLSYRRNPFLALSTASIFYALILVPRGTYEMLDTPRSGLQAVGQTFLPEIALSVLASYLAARGGVLPAALYHSAVQAFEWFSPVLPNVEWTLIAFSGTVAPLISLLVVRGILSDEESEGEPVRYDVPAPWVAASMAVVALLWFNMGMLGVQPSVVSGGSMEPSMEVGDLALTRPVDAGDLRVGDVVRFREGSTPVLHRLIKIERSPQGRLFVTQGDANNAPDPPIIAEQIEGKVVVTVPKAGWVPITLGRMFQQLY